MHSELLFLLYLFGRTIRKQANTAHGDQILEAALLWLCSGGKQTARDLGSALGVSASTISEQIRDLITKGYLAEEPSKNDKREILLTLTSSGTKCLTNITAKMNDMCVPVLEPLTIEERLILTTLLKKLLVRPQISSANVV
jgi:DNA-binding MarR family transcriptional regulator